MRLLVDRREPTLSSMLEFVRDETSSWIFVPKQVVGIAPYAIIGASAAKPWGAVVFGSEGKNGGAKSKSPQKRR